MIIKIIIKTNQDIPYARNGPLQRVKVGHPTRPQSVNVLKLIKYTGYTDYVAIKIISYSKISDVTTT